jgi:predicted phage-related endonuclease
MIEQRSEEWHIERYGKITASEVCKILCKDDKWSQTALSYIYKLAAERMLDEGCMMPNNIKSAAIDWGIEQEEAARCCYEELTGFDVDVVGFKTLKDNEFIGASADGLVKQSMFEDTYIRGLEIKCPYNPENHTRLMKELELPKEHYAQVQLNMMVYEFDIWDYLSYCPLLKKGKNMVIITVKKDETFQRKMLEQCKKALTEVELICGL